MIPKEVWCIRTALCRNRGRWTALVGNRCWKALGRATGDRKGSDGKNRTIFLGGVHMVEETLL